jgi:hypothetical protein
MSLATIAARSSYKGWFLTALLVATFLPALVSVANVDVFNQQEASLVFAFSMVAVLAGTHVWLTLAYYFDRRWLKLFSTNPLVFFVVPGAILLACIGVTVLSSNSVVLALIYGGTYVNLWHSSKQNWGVLSVVAKGRVADVSGIRLAIVYAWPFFIVPWTMQFPALDAAVGHALLYKLSIASAAAYVLFAAATISRSKGHFGNDPIVWLLIAEIAVFFLPLVLMYGKPYSVAIWAAAHGAQYYVFVLASLSLRQRKSSNWGPLLISLAIGLAAIAALTGLSLQFPKWAGWGGGPILFPDVWPRVLIGVIKGVGLSHFWIDAFIWRLSQKEVRALHGDALAF